MHLTCVVGARPNFMKMAPILESARHAGLTTRLVHTGQHYDERMSALFFDELGMPVPDVFLGVGSGTHGAQTGRTMIAFDSTLDDVPTDLVVVVGDVNSTLACALVAAKRGVPIAHVEAGLRSGDLTMPEEINRILTDRISDFLFTTERTAADNLRAEGLPQANIHFVGNVMIDTLVRYRARARATHLPVKLGLPPGAYAVCTLHRPSNVDTFAAAANTVAAVEMLARRLPVAFPLHPRSRAKLAEFGLLGRLTSCHVQLLEPLGYLEFLALMSEAFLVLTDSGGIQEETTALGVPCLTFRNTTERPITVTEGTNHVVGLDPETVARHVEELLRGESKQWRIPELWDGRAAERIVGVLQTHGAKAQQPNQQACSTLAN